MPEYICEICDYKTTKKSSYDKHLKTEKHKQKVEQPKNEVENEVEKEDEEEDEDEKEEKEEILNEVVKLLIKLIFEINGVNIEKETLLINILKRNLKELISQIRF